MRNVGFRYAIQPWYLAGRYSEFLLLRYPVGEAQQRRSAASLSPPTKLHPFPTPAVTHALPEMQCFRHLLAVSDSSTFGSQHLNSNSVEHSFLRHSIIIGRKKQQHFLTVRSSLKVTFKSNDLMFDSGLEPLMVARLYNLLGESKNFQHLFGILCVPFIFKWHKINLLS